MALQPVVKLFNDIDRDHLCELGLVQSAVALERVNYPVKIRHEILTVITEALHNDA